MLTEGCGKKRIISLTVANRLKLKGGYQNQGGACQRPRLILVHWEIHFIAQRNEGEVLLVQLLRTSYTFFNFLALQSREQEDIVLV